MTIAHSGDSYLQLWRVPLLSLLRTWNQNEFHPFHCWLISNFKCRSPPTRVRHYFELFRWTRTEVHAGVWKPERIIDSVIFRIGTAEPTDQLNQILKLGARKTTFFYRWRSLCAERCACCFLTVCNLMQSMAANPFFALMVCRSASIVFGHSTVHAWPISQNKNNFEN